MKFTKYHHTNSRKAHAFVLLKFVVVALALCGLALRSDAQLNPFQSMYYKNRYMLNPALAGIDQGLNLNIGYRQQWSSFPGTPKTSAFTADYQAGDRVGLGLNITDDQSGLIRATRAVGTYAYHLPTGDQNQHLSFGFSLGVNNSRVDLNKVNGDVSDDQLAAYNSLKPYVDGDLGVAYTTERFMASVSMPNLRTTLFKESDTRFDVDLETFVAAVSYKFGVQDTYPDLILEPLAAFRMVKGYKNIFDAGFNLDMKNYGLFLQGIYHTNQNMTVGCGLDQKSYVLSFNYNLETGQLSNYTHGAFELGLKINLFNEKSK